MKREQQIEECQKQLAELQEKLERLKREQKQYVIPFQFEKCCGSGDTIAIPFNECKQLLIYSTADKIWKVFEPRKSDLITCRLASEPTPVGELKTGYTYFELHNGHEIDNAIERKPQYFKYLGDKQAYIHEDDFSVIVYDVSTRHTYYQVLPM